MKDLISIDQLSLDSISIIHNFARQYYLAPNVQHQDLAGKFLVNFFFENSTRTRMSFELAAKKMGAEVINIDISLSSLKKNESITDTAKTINAMNPDFVAVRHNLNGIVAILKKHFNCSLINAGDGTNEHPSQALLDSFVILKNKKSLENLKIAICGDVLHSRVARSNIKLLKKFNCQIRVITPSTLISFEYKNWLKKKWNIDVFEDLESGIRDVDVIMMLRIQQERMIGCYVPSFSEYFKLYGLNHRKLKSAPNAIIMHPGPINREVEISSDLADDPSKTLILDQVEAGVFVRQAILKFLIS